MLVQEIFFFIASTFLLIKSADFLVDNAEKLGKSLGVPSFLIGVLILAIGTSLPELATSISASMKGETDIVVSNILGSNIANILLGFGFLTVVTQKHISFKQNLFQVHFPVLIMAVFTVFITLSDKVITPYEGLIFLGFLAAYVWFLFAKDEKLDHEVDKNPPAFEWKFVLFVIIGLVGLSGASHFLVESVIALAEIFQVGTGSLAASVVAVGTSVPELAVGISAIKKRNTEMLVGNIIGSNIFNIVLILGVSSFLAPLEISAETYEILMPFFVGSTFVYWVSKQDQRITIQEGAAMLCLYVLFLGKLFHFI